MALEANFKNVLSSDFKIMSIVDASTYDGETISSRKLKVTNDKGELTEYNFPIILGVGDILEIPSEKDEALIVELELTPINPVDSSEYIRTKNLLLPNRLLECIARERKHFLHLCDTNCSFERELYNVEVMDSFYQGARYLIGTDIVGAQEALNKGNKLCKNNICNTCQ